MWVIVVWQIGGGQELSSVHLNNEGYVCVAHHLCGSKFGAARPAAFQQFGMLLMLLVGVIIITYIIGCDYYY